MRPYKFITPALLLELYETGLFPMGDGFESDSFYIVEPERRGILPLEDFHASGSLRRTLRRGTFSVTFDRAFARVMLSCAKTRPETWINRPLVRLYSALAQAGHAHSVEAWNGDGRLAGGLYGVVRGGAFFGESMFSKETDASKVALFHLVEHLKARGFVLLDTQFTTKHLLSLGAKEVSQPDYMKMLQKALDIRAEW